MIIIVNRELYMSVQYRTTYTAEACKTHTINISLSVLFSRVSLFSSCTYLGNKTHILLWLALGLSGGFFYLCFYFSSFTTLTCFIEYGSTKLFVIL